MNICEIIASLCTYFNNLWLTVWNENAKILMRAFATEKRATTLQNK